MSQLTKGASNSPAILSLGVAPLAAPFEGGMLLLRAAISLYVTLANGALNLGPRLSGIRNPAGELCSN